MLDVFGSTHPGSSNVVEWQRICANSIIQHSDEKDEDQFKHFVETLSNICPGIDNQVEWAATRSSATEIKTLTGILRWSSFFAASLKRLLAILTLEEWSRIRNVSSEVLNSVKPAF